MLPCDSGILKVEKENSCEAGTPSSLSGGSRVLTSLIQSWETLRGCPDGQHSLLTQRLEPHKGLVVASGLTRLDQKAAEGSRGALSQGEQGAAPEYTSKRGRRRGRI